MSNAKKAEKLIADVAKKLATWNERSSFRMKSVSNLSKSDLDTIVLYAEAIQQTGSYSCYMKPRGGVRDVLNAYGLLQEEEVW